MCTIVGLNKILYQLFISLIIAISVICNEAKNVSCPVDGPYTMGLFCAVYSGG